MTGALSKGLHRLGIVSRSIAPSIMFYGSDQSAFEAIAPVLKRLAQTEQRLETFLCTSNPEAGRWLKQAFPSLKSVFAPFGISLATILFLKQLRVRVLILLEDETPPSAAFLKCLRNRSISIVLMSGRGQAHLKPRYLPEKGADLLLAIDSEASLQTLVDERLTLIPSATGRCDRIAADKALDHLTPLLGKNQKWTNRGDRPLSRMLARWLHRRLNNPVRAPRYKRFIQRYDDKNQLRKSLGSPEIILCLGNGPSSEHPDLGQTAHDALFRVNHSWMNRSVLVNPDVVFTGGKSSMRALKAPIFGLQHQTGEMVLLETRGPWAFRHRLRYFSMERLGRYLEDFDWGTHRPTNGAAMIAMAVALKPKRLIIAGIDLFRHPDGSYPGDQATPNAYTPAHSSDKELAFMFHHLDRFDGEVVIFGEILDREWRLHLERRQHLDEAG